MKTPEEIIRILDSPTETKRWAFLDKRGPRGGF